MLNVIQFGVISDWTNYTTQQATYLTGSSSTLGIIVLLVCAGLLLLLTSSLEITFLFLIPIIWTLVIGGVLSIVAGILISVVLAGFLTVMFTRAFER